MQKLIAALLSLLVVTGAVVAASTIRPTSSIITPAATGTSWVVSLDANSLSTTDANVQSSLSPVKSFRVGAVINASSTNPLNGVLGWQFSITYDNTTLAPQGDPAPALANDAAENTVAFGSQGGGGNPNWAARLPTQAFGSSKIADVDAFHRKIMVFYTILPPNPAVSIGPTLSATVNGNLLANVAFEIVRKPVSPIALTIGDVEFVDATAATIPNINPGPDVTETISDSPPLASFTATPLPNDDPSCFAVTGSNCGPYAFKFNGLASSDVDGTIADPAGYFWDFGDGSQNNVNSVATCLVTTCNQGSVAIHDYGVSGSFTVTLRVVDSQGNTGSARDTLGNVTVNNQPSHALHTVYAFVPPSGSGTGGGGGTRTL